MGKGHFRREARWYGVADVKVCLIIFEEVKGRTDDQTAGDRQLGSTTDVDR